MTRLFDSSHTEKLGVSEVQAVCAKARTVFRPLTIDDVGIDGFIEVMEEGHATGVVAGVQIKSGDSYTNEDGTEFTFASDRDHFGYWARCSFPVIGVVYGPKHGRSVWLDLTSLSSDERIVEGPYRETLEYTDATAFTPHNLLWRVVPIIVGHAHQRRTLWQIRQLVKDRRQTSEEQKSRLLVPGLEASGDKEESWYRLIGCFLEPSNEDAAVADAGYRLSWYFPMVSAKLQGALLRRLDQVDDLRLTRIFGAVYYLIMDVNANEAAGLVIDLLGYVPDARKRLERLMREHKLPSFQHELAIQVMEMLDG